MLCAFFCFFFHAVRWLPSRINGWAAADAGPSVKSRVDGWQDRSDWGCWELKQKRSPACFIRGKERGSKGEGRHKIQGWRKSSTLSRSLPSRWIIAIFVGWFCRIAFFFSGGYLVVTRGHGRRRSPRNRMGRKDISLSQAVCFFFSYPASTLIAFSCIQLHLTVSAFPLLSGGRR